jgi:hypothetical protein
LKKFRIVLLIVRFPGVNVSKITLSGLPDCVALPGSSRSRHFNFRFQPDLSIVEVVLGAFGYMDACLLLITIIVSVKPENQSTFFQDFWSLSGYLCCVPEMLRTTIKPNDTVE